MAQDDIHANATSRPSAGCQASIASSVIRSAPVSIASIASSFSIRKTLAVIPPHPCRIRRAALADSTLGCRSGRLRMIASRCGGRPAAPIAFSRSVPPSLTAASPQASFDRPRDRPQPCSAPLLETCSQIIGNCKSLAFQQTPSQITATRHGAWGGERRRKDRRLSR